MSRLITINRSTFGLDILGAVKASIGFTLVTLVLLLGISGNVTAFQIEPTVRTGSEDTDVGFPLRDNVFGRKSPTIIAGSSERPLLVPRIVKIPLTYALPSSTITVRVILESEGGEAGVSFTLNYDPTKLTANSVSLGADMGGAFLALNDDVAGKRGIGVTRLTGYPAPVPPQTFIEKEIVTISFTVSSSVAPNEVIPLTFDGSQAPLSVSVCCPTATVASSFTNGVVQILEPTAAAVTLSGRVVTAEGYGVPFVQIMVRNQMGEAVSAVTNPFGFYSFDNLQSGETYFIEAVSRRYAFTPAIHVRSLTDDVTGVDFMAQE